MEQYIPKSTLVKELEKRIKEHHSGYLVCLKDILSSLNTLEVTDPYEQCVQYPSVKDGIQAHAETYSFNIESLLFNQLTKEQQKLWRKEIEQACISGGEAGVELARDMRYKENLEVKEVDLEVELNKWRHNHFHGRRDKDASGEYLERISQLELAKYFFELGLHSTITEEDCKLIWSIGDEIPNMPEEEFFKELLRRYKAQKGE